MTKDTSIGVKWVKLTQHERLSIQPIHEQNNGFGIERINKTPKKE